MMSELFDEEYLREQYNKSIKKEMLTEGKITTLIGLVRDGLLSMSEAAKRAEMSVSEFEAKVKLN